MAKYTVYHSDAHRHFGDYSIEKEQLARIDAELELIDAGKSAEELATLMTDAEAVIVGSAPITAAVLDSMPKCKVVVRYGVGLDTLDLDAATERNVVCAHVPDFCMEEVANHALMLMLAVVKKLVPLDRAVRDGTWRPGPLSPMMHLHGQTLGLVACGNIAQAMAKRGLALSMQVIGYDPYVDRDVAAAAGIELVDSLDELLSRADVVSVHAPLTPQTHHLIDNGALSRMKRSAYLINTSRGPTVDEAALVEALQEHKIAGAGLDVFEQEPLPATSPLNALDNVVLMPHSASYSDDAFQRLSRRVGESVVDVLSGHWPRFVANKGILEKLKLKPTLHPD
ncbi:MAG: C-terminal binding protein [Gammaproteobacteria bacterium]